MLIQINYNWLTIIPIVVPPRAVPVIDARAQPPRVAHAACTVTAPGCQENEQLTRAPRPPKNHLYYYLITREGSFERLYLLSHTAFDRRLVPL